MTEFTRGPYRAIPNGYDNAQDVDPYYWGIVGGDFETLNDDGFHLTGFIREQDARRLAAAWELREALVISIEHLEEMRKDAKWHPIGHCPVLDAARALLARIEGGA